MREVSNTFLIGAAGFAVVLALEFQKYLSATDILGKRNFLTASTVIAAFLVAMLLVGILARLWIPVRIYLLRRKIRKER